MCQLDISKDPIHCVVIFQEHFGAVSAAFNVKDRSVAKLPAVANADELA